MDATIEAALARCKRDANGLLKLGNLWADPQTAHHGLSSAIKRSGLSAHVVLVKAGRMDGRGAYAPERVARQLARSIPPGHLWRDASSSTAQQTGQARPSDAHDAENHEADSNETEASQKDARSQLAELLGRPMTRMRTTPDGKIALIDITMIFTDLINDQAGLAVRRLLEAHPDVRSTISNFKFPGRGQKAIDVAPLATAIEFAFLLPSKKAAAVRRQAAQLLVRFVGGDLSLVDDVMRSKRVQDQLSSIPEEQRTPLEQAARLCGEAVEAQLPSPPAPATPALEAPVFIPRKPLVIQDEDSVGLPGSDHLYAAARHGENLIKVGTSKDVLQRLRELAQSFGGQYELLAVWPNEAVLENLVIELLKTAKATVGSSREHFNANAGFEQICQIVVAARHLHKMKTELETAGTKRKREEAEFQEELADRALKRRQQEIQMTSEEAERAMKIRQQETQIKRDETQIKRDETQIAQQEARTNMLLELVRQGDEDAKRVFLASLATGQS
jgi:hypothetical protein